MAKGKDYKHYQYGNKVSVASTAKGNVREDIVSHDKNIHDGHALPRCLRTFKPREENL